MTVLNVVLYAINSRIP